MDGHTPSFIDLFAGCGGLSLGLSQAGLRGTFAIERDAMAFDTLATNLVREGAAAHLRFDWPKWLEERAWAIDDLLADHQANLAKLRGKVDVIAGGPPCQGFSFAGRRMEQDPRNLLLYKYVEVVALLKPSVLILENVPGMRVAHRSANVVDLFGQPQQTPKSFYEKLADSLYALDYDVQATLLDASAYGVPQRRSRLIAIGVRRDVAARLTGGVQRVFDLLEAARRAQLKDLHLRSPVSARQAISDLETNDRELIACDDPESPRGFSQAVPARPTTNYQKLMREGHEGVPNSMRLARHGEEVRSRFARILIECRKGVRMDDEARLSYGLKKHRIYPMAPDDPAPTITTLPDDVLHYSEPRILTVRESARLQSFPDWFEFRGKFTTGGDRRTSECPRYTQVGNAVPPLLARAIGSAVRATLCEAERSEREMPNARRRAMAGIS